MDRFVYEMQPTKAEMKKRLAEVRDAALLLRDALNDTPIREFLEIAPLGPIEFRGVFDQMVQELAGRAERAMASTLLSTETGKTKAGRTRAMPPDASSAKLFCAALVAEAWAYFYHSDPPPRNQDAARAADVRPIVTRRITPAQAVADHKNDPADHPPVIDPRNTAHLVRQQRPKPLELLLAQPKLAHISAPTV